jgi:hypothetical protein
MERIQGPCSSHRNEPICDKCENPWFVLPCLFTGGNPWFVLSSPFCSVVRICLVLIAIFGCLQYALFLSVVQCDALYVQLFTVQYISSIQF